MADNQWQIESRQKRVAGVGAHNYFALVDPDGNVVDELHGVNDNKTSGLLVTGGLHALTSEFLNPEIDGAAKIFEAGDRGAMAHRWKELVDAGNGLSGKARYSALGPNSNSFWASVLGSVGKNYRDYEPNSRNWTPGTGINLTNPIWWADRYRMPDRPPTKGDRSGVDQPGTQIAEAPSAANDGYARGGLVRHSTVPGDPPGPDNVFIAAQTGEGVLSRRAMAKLGPRLFAVLNAGDFDRDAVAAVLHQVGGNDEPEPTVLRRLKGLADLSEDDFAAATEGRRWREQFAR